MNSLGKLMIKIGAIPNRNEKAKLRVLHPAVWILIALWIPIAFISEGAKEFPENMKELWEQIILW